MTAAFSTVMTMLFSSGAPFRAHFSLSASIGRTSSNVAAATAHRRRRRWQTATIGGLHAEHQHHHSHACVSA